MTFQFAEIARQAAADAAISPGEILALRRAGWADGAISREEAEAIFAIQRALAAPDADWCDFLVEAIREYVLNAAEPRGYAGEEDARWLIAQVEQDGKICSMVELELLASIIEKAESVPEALRDFTLDAIEQAVLGGAGALRRGGSLSGAHVTEGECRLMRRVIFGVASDRPAAVSRREAEMLFRIKDAMLHAANAPEWKCLFVQGVGNYLMGFASSAPLEAERMLELQRFVDDNSASVGRFLGGMARTSPNALRVVFGRKRPSPSPAERAAEAATITGPEQDWLAAHIDANGEVDEYDRALLHFIAEEVGA
ncbi:conserved hypothetical protein [Altererythrobacter sp. B11]|uniref:hypothetical protein n=1 Tax=Altererythrobacter sp. B11 TaxID=2060312 RepID=UPI000DC6DC21|nr:hypothetical protein [Altererythrobacter sp. B11]BBC71502.1 conserved hypothetical protein [Altererythrobacter sp. B11]